jgi:hypothetical protein
MEAKPGGPGSNAEECTPGHEFASVHVPWAIGNVIAVVMRRAGGLSDVFWHACLLLCFSLGCHGAPNRLTVQRVEVRIAVTHR